MNAGARDGQRWHSAVADSCFASPDHHYCALSKAHLSQLPRSCNHQGEIYVSQAISKAGSSLRNKREAANLFSKSET